MEKLLRRINFIFFTFIGSSMLHLVLFAIEDVVNKFDKEKYWDSSSDNEQVG